MLRMNSTFVDQAERGLGPRPFMNLHLQQTRSEPIATNRRTSCIQLLLERCSTDSHKPAIKASLSPSSFIVDSSIRTSSAPGRSRSTRQLIRPELPETQRRFRQSNRPGIQRFFQRWQVQRVPRLNLLRLLIHLPVPLIQSPIHARSALIQV